MRRTPLTSRFYNKWNVLCICISFISDWVPQIIYQVILKPSIDILWNSFLMPCRFSILKHIQFKCDDILTNGSFFTAF